MTSHDRPPSWNAFLRHRSVMLAGDSISRMKYFSEQDRLIVSSSSSNGSVTITDLYCKRHMYRFNVAKVCCQRHWMDGLDNRFGWLSHRWQLDWLDDPWQIIYLHLLVSYWLHRGSRVSTTTNRRRSWSLVAATDSSGFGIATLLKDLWPYFKVTDVEFLTSLSIKLLGCFSVCPGMGWVIWYLISNNFNHMCMCGSYNDVTM